jgi:hypothetical protein
VRSFLSGPGFNRSQYSIDALKIRPDPDLPKPCLPYDSCNRFRVPESQLKNQPAGGCEDSAGFRHQ